MSFSPIVANTKTFNEAGPGRYMQSTVTFGSPLSYFRVSPGTKNSKNNFVSGSASRILEKDVTVGTSLVRKSASVQLVIQSQAGISTAELRDLITDLNAFLSAVNLDRILNGEQ